MEKSNTMFCQHRLMRVWRTSQCCFDVYVIGIAWLFMVSKRTQVFCTHLNLKILFCRWRENLFCEFKSRNHFSDTAFLCTFLVPAFLFSGLVSLFPFDFCAEGHHVCLPTHCEHRDWPDKMFYLLWGRITFPIYTRVSGSSMFLLILPSLHTIVVEIHSSWRTTYLPVFYSLTVF